MSKSPFYHFIFFCLLLPVVIRAQEISHNDKGKNFGNKSLFFIENKGQIKNQNGDSRNDIDFKLSTGAGLNIFIGKDGLHYQWCKETSPRPSSKEKGVLCNETDCIGSGDFSFRRNGGIDEASMYRMDMELVGANPLAEMKKEEMQDYYETYYTPPFSPDKVGIVHSFTKITYKNIYNDIDWVLYIKNNKLEYDFVVHPGGNVKNVQMKFGGDTSLVRNSNGALEFYSAAGRVAESKPFSYMQADGHEIASAFSIKDSNTIGFDVERHDEGTLIIDPSLDWCTYFGGSQAESVTSNSLVIDRNKKMYLTGWTNSTNNIATIGAYQYSYHDSSDAFIAKYSSGGTLLWSTYFGGNGSELGPCISSDGSNIYIGGQTSSNSNISTSGAFQGTFGGGGGDAFLAKFSASGSLIWSTYYGSDSLDEISAISCDAAGKVYVCGATKGITNIASPGAYQYNNGGNSDAFLVKFDSSGHRIWATYYGGNSYDNGTGLVCDSSSIVYLAGKSHSSNNIASPGAYQGLNNGNYDAYLAKFDSSGSRIWATFYGGSGQEDETEITLDGNDKVYICGRTTSTTNIASIGTHQVAFGGSNDAYLAKFDSYGGRIWGTYYGGSNSDIPNGVKCDAAGYVYVTGSTQSSSNVATGNAYQASLAGPVDAFIAKFDNQGILRCGSYFGGGASDGGFALSCDDSNNIYLAGQTTSSINLATIGAYQYTYGGGGQDDFLARFSSDTDVYIPLPYKDTVFCAGDTFSLAYQVNKPFLSGNVFTIQLSNSSGSFGSSVNIGNVSATSQGTIFCTIPGSTPSGSGYKIRIIASDPADTSNDDDMNIKIANFGSVTLGSNSPVCSGDGLNVMVSSAQPGANCVWTGPQSFSDSNQNAWRANIGLADSGYYYASLSLHNCTAHDSVYVQIKPSPVIMGMSNNSPVCAGDSLHIVSSCSPTGLIYSWNGPGSFSSVDSGFTIYNTNSSDSGAYYLSLQLNGCYTLDTVMGIIKPVPAKPNAIASNPICASDTLKLHATDITSGISWQWTGPNSFISTQQNPVLLNATLSDSGNYVVKAVLNGCSSAIDTIHVHIDPLISPTVSISSLPPVIIPSHVDTFTASIGTACDSPSYQWYKNGVKQTGATGSTYITSLFTNDHISVVVHCSGPCFNPDSASSNSLTTDVKNVENVRGVNIYPNPATSIVYIEAKEKVNVRILSMEGKILLMKDDASTINISALPAGLYMIRVYNRDGVVLKNEKMVKE